jgi:sugar O-acyltransferase (sialic acid O-acetyltransferase NeuD family)
MSFNNRPVVVIGGGGHAKVTVEALLKAGENILGFVDNQDIQERPHGLSWLGDDTVVAKYSTEEILLANGIGSLPGKTLRWKIYRHFSDLGFKFINIVHPSATIAGDVQLKEGAQIMAGAVIQTGTVVGLQTIINTSASVDHDCEIGDFVHVAPGATLSGGVRISKNVHIGTGATIIQGIEIGADSIIGAGAVVVHDIEANSKVISPGVKASNISGQGQI